jgi:predicted dehydrogenase
MLADFQKRYPDVKAAASEDEILNDPSIQLVASAAIPDLRAPLGIRVMRHGKDYLSDKPGITTLEQLAEVRKDHQRDRPHVRHHVLRAAGSAGRGEGRRTDEGRRHRKGGADRQPGAAPGHAPTRPDWFWDPARYGGILCDIGSHQADQFVYYTGSTVADVTASQVANVNHRPSRNFRISAT